MSNEKLLITISLLTGAGFSLLAALTMKLISRTSYFSWAVHILSEIKLPEKPRTKSDFRKIRKYKPLIDRAKKRIFLMFMLHIVVFMFTYTASIYVLNTYIPPHEQIVEIPIYLPFLSMLSENHFATNALFLTLIGYLAPSYLIMRAVYPTTR